MKDKGGKKEKPAPAAKKEAPKQAPAAQNENKRDSAELEKIVLKAVNDNG